MGTKLSLFLALLFPVLGLISCTRADAPDDDDAPDLPAPAVTATPAPAAPAPGKLRLKKEINHDVDANTTLVFEWPGTKVSGLEIVSSCTLPTDKDKPSANRSFHLPAGAALVVASLLPPESFQRLSFDDFRRVPCLLTATATDAAGKHDQLSLDFVIQNPETLESLSLRSDRDDSNTMEAFGAGLAESRDSGEFPEQGTFNLVCERVANQRAYTRAKSITNVLSDLLLGMLEHQNGPDSRAIYTRQNCRVIRSGISAVTGLPVVAMTPITRVHFPEPVVEVTGAAGLQITPERIDVLARLSVRDLALARITLTNRSGAPQGFRFPLPGSRTVQWTEIMSSLASLRPDANPDTLISTPPIELPVTWTIDGGGPMVVDGADQIFEVAPGASAVITLQLGETDVKCNAMVIDRPYDPRHGAQIAGFHYRISAPLSLRRYDVWDPSQAANRAGTVHEATFADGGAGAATLSGVDLLASGYLSNHPGAQSAAYTDGSARGFSAPACGSGPLMTHF